MWQFSKADNFPCVVLLEFWPFSASEPVQQAQSDVDYSLTYRALARHYQLPVWSLRDVVWSLDDSQSRYANVLQFRGVMPDFPHPNWWVHFFFADLLASVTLHYERECASKPEQGMQSVPPRLYAADSNEDISCDPSIQPLVVARPRLNDSTGNMSYGWNILNDHGKLGWVVESRNESAAELAFKIDDPNGVMDTSSTLLRIAYLRTYVNAGAAQVFICGTHIPTVWPQHQLFLDALWPNYKSNRVSTSEVASFIVPAEICKKASREIKIVHQRIIDNHTISVRAKQKFKILSVHLCLEAKDVVSSPSRMQTHTVLSRQSVYAFTVIALALISSFMHLRGHCRLITRNGHSFV
jgi:hypothetical protein